MRDAQGDSPRSTLTELSPLLTFDMCCPDLSTILMAGLHSAPCVDTPPLFPFVVKSIKKLSSLKVVYAGIIVTLGIEDQIV